MKKFFALAAVAAMFIACGEKPEPTPKPEPKPDVPSNEYVQPIKMDGNFDDWAALDASKVAVATLPTGVVKHDGLLVAKAYCDANYLFVYGEYNTEAVVDLGWVPFHIYINIDNDQTTGGGGDDFGAPYCCDYLLETALIQGEGNFVYDPALFPWAEWAPVGEAGWNWTVLPEGEDGTSENNYGAMIGEGNGIGSAAGTGNAFEIAILKEMIGVEFADTFQVGFDIQQEWSTCGFLPQAEATDENPNGCAGLLTVTTVK